MIKFPRIFTPKNSYKAYSARAEELVNIDSRGIKQEKVNLLFDSRQTVANYLNREGYSADFFDPRKLNGKNADFDIEKDNVMVKLTNNLNGESRQKLVEQTPNEHFLRSVYRTIETMLHSMKK